MIVAIVRKTYVDAIHVVLTVVDVNAEITDVEVHAVHALAVIHATLQANAKSHQIVAVMGTAIAEKIARIALMIVDVDQKKNAEEVNVFARPIVQVANVGMMGVKAPVDHVEVTNPAAEGTV
jgi:hypothetical protein